MKTLVLEQPQQFRLIDSAAPQAPGPDQVLVRIRRVGVCGTDLHAFEGTQPFFSYPRVLGHELAGEIVALGPTDTVHDLQLGDRCAIEPYLNCGHCSTCRRGKTNCCENLRVLGVHVDGGMRESISVPIDKVHRSPILPLDHLALVEPLSIGAHAVRRAGTASGDLVLVIGAGPIGLATALSARATGARVAIMEINEQRAQFARQHLGIEHFVDATRDPLPQLAQFADGSLPPTVFDATGSARSMMDSVRYVANGGTLIFVGFVQGTISFDDPEFHRRELSLLRSRNATHQDFAGVVKILESGSVDMTPWITHRATPEGFIQQFERWLKPETGAVKALLEL